MALHIRQYLESLAACHLASYIEDKFPERGGIMLVGPPEVLKSTMLDVLDRQYGDVVAMSDVNAKSLAALRDAVASGRLRSLIFPDFGKLYERKIDTALNVEGVLRALVAEGFSAASFEDSRVAQTLARATVLGAMTPAIQRTHFDRWDKTGFSRRFLWSLVALDNPRILDRAVEAWERLSFGLLTLPRPPLDGSPIPHLTTTGERQRIRMFLKYQPGMGSAIQFQLLVKMLSVLRWWYQQSGDSRNPMDTLEAFAQTLGKHGGYIQLDLPGISWQRQAAQRKRVERSEQTAAARKLRAGQVAARKRGDKKR
jgi:hypothetical protein